MIAGKPRDGIVVGGVDLYDAYGLAMGSDYELVPPAPKVYEVDVPGGDGCVDVTQAVFGDTAYEDRSMTFRFLSRKAGPAFQALLSEVMGFLHGRRFDFSLSFDPGYTYNGRFSVDEAFSRMHEGEVKVAVRARPYKFKEHRRVRVAAKGGTTVVLECGRKRQCPKVTCTHVTTVKVGDQLAATLPIGEWTIPELWLHRGDNPVYVNSAPWEADALISDHADKTAASMAGMFVYEALRKEVADDEDGYAVWFEYDIEEL